MKNAIRLALAGTALLGYAVAHAQGGPPTSGTSDLWLFVTDPATDETYARDTGISITSLAPSTLSISAKGESSPVSINLAADSTLLSFLAAANSAGQTLYWGVQGGNYLGGTGNVPGQEDIVQANTLPASNTENIKFNPSFTDIFAGLNGDEQYMDLAAGQSAVFDLADGTPVGNAWGASGNGPGSVNLYGQGQNGEIALTSEASLYFLTGANSTTAIESYILANDNLELTSNGTLETVSASPVPLPPALWLLGSGLLGLAGVGRRRRSPAA